MEYIITIDGLYLANLKEGICYLTIDNAMKWPDLTAAQLVAQTIRMDHPQHTIEVHSLEMVPKIELILRFDPNILNARPD